MTAEVVILNREAVAIAADSAVTIEGAGTKVYTSANKVFALSKTEPVAVMVYSAASFEGIPWETVVKDYRRRLGRRAFSTVEDYAHGFLGHLDSLIRYLPADADLRRVQSTAVAEIAAIRDKILALNPPFQGVLGPASIAQVAMDAIDSRIGQLQQEAQGDYRCRASVAAGLFDAAFDDWAPVATELWGRVPMTEQLLAKSKDLVCTRLRVVAWSPWSSGVVVVGFGADQLFPSLHHYLVDGVIASEVRVAHHGEWQIDHDNSGAIIPFAQYDMVATFMDGIYPHTATALEGYVDEMLDLFARRVGSQVQDLLEPTAYGELLDTMGQVKTELVGSFQHRMLPGLKETESRPIMSIVGSLPKEELAELAEALVSLTALKRRVTPVAETVGGPVDVAVISKGDGLVWIKRKHYFKPELNPRYFQRDREV